VALTWLAALAASAFVGVLRARTVPPREGSAVPRRAFLQSSGRNLSGGAAEALPGLLLAPLVLAVDGPAAAAYFGMAWTAASLVFQTSAAIGRSALAQMIQAGAGGRAAAVRKGVVQHLWLVAPLAVLGSLFAPRLLALFGPAYAEQGGAVLALLCASAVFVAPTSLYLAVLRARDRSLALILFPAAMVVSLAVLAPALDARLGLIGVALAWLLSNVPFGAYAAWRLHQEVQGVTPLAPPAAAPVARPLDLE
jgi:O-antigen/teichoic acid export membrane protein